MAEPFAAILVAAGRSTRMGTDKLWIDFWGRPAWRWSLDALLAAPMLTHAAVVVPAEAISRFSDALPAEHRNRCIVVPGRESRADSVIAGIWSLTGAGHNDATLVLVHDAARPAVTLELIERVADAATDGPAVPVIPVPDALKRVRAERIAGAIEPEDVVAAQTPQAARLGVLRAAIEEAHAWGRPVLDDVAALTAAGRSVRAVAGDPANRKLTTPDDVAAMRGILAARASPVSSLATQTGARCGIGFDAHRFADDRPLRLGGLDFPDATRGLAGHSDGDAALHAVIDALLGAAGRGDLGVLFPSDDADLAGADSGDLLRRALELVAAAGWRPSSLDVTIVATEPPIAPRREELVARLAELTGLGSDAIGMKGTTSDGLGFAGREGIAAWAVAVVEPLG